MAGKNKKNKIAAEEKVSKRQKTAQMLFAAFAVVLIVSMVLSAFVTY
ncbi:MAG: hypothetical protein LC099_06030 [Anaerolineales bacterium]|nr:hypothetical protein [Anaerolineales bacterium]